MSLASVAAFKAMKSEDLAQLEAGSVTLEPRDGTTIIAQGDPADAVYAIVAGDGHVRIGAIDRHSKALMVEVFRIGEIFGEIGVIDDGLGLTIGYLVTEAEDVMIIDDRGRATPAHPIAIDQESGFALVGV